MDDHMAHDERYARAREFYDVVTGLWDSFSDDAFLRDQDTGIFFDTQKLHTLNHAGKYFKVRGPLNVARPPQGWPVIVQAGASDAGRQLAAETAEMVFAAGGPIATAQAFYADVKARAKAAGRNPDHLKILPGALIIVDDTIAGAQAKKRLLDSLVHEDSGMAALSIALGMDASTLSLDEALPEIPDTNASKTARERVLELAARNNFTVRQLAQYLGGYGGLSFVGTPASIADSMQEWLETNACDGFNIMFHTVPAGLEEFVDQVVPELQRRGIFRTEYTGTTLRDHLGLPRPENQFFRVR
jgi:alkanesulfonate monooxygenase